ncbi:MAG: SurA N-terminal domain-containing protein, partial [Clostridiales bacterium]
MRKLLVLAMTVLSFSFVLLGCSYQPNENADVEAAAKVNGKVAPVWQYDFYYNQGKGYMQQYGMDLTAESPETKSMLAMLEQNAWEAIINNQIIQQAADEMNIKVKSSEVKKLFEENIRSSFEKDEDYQKWLTDSSMSEDNVLQVIALQEIHRKLFE